MLEILSLLAEALKRGASPAALRARLSYAHDRSEDIAVDIADLEASRFGAEVTFRDSKRIDRKLARKRRALTFWKSRAVALQGRLRDGA